MGALFILPLADSFSASVVAEQVHMQCTLTYSMKVTGGHLERSEALSSWGKSPVQCKAEVARKMRKRHSVNRLNSTAI